MTGITFSVFLGPDEHFWIFECPVALWLLIREDHPAAQNQGGYILLRADKPPNWKQITQTTRGKGNKIQLFFFSAARGCTGDGNLWFNFKFQIFYSGNEVSVATKKFLGPRNLHSFSCVPLETWFFSDHNFSLPLFAPIFI
jgi:hypothetical protein